MKILCGPVVGLVTPHTARVLLEVDTSSSVQMLLVATTEPEHRLDRTLHLQARSPFAFSFQDLRENTTYKVYLPGIKPNKVMGQVNTLPNDLRKIEVAVVSCDLNNVPAENGGMWRLLYERCLQKDVHLVLHIGDNIYMDELASYKLDGNKVLVEDEEQLFDPTKVDQTTPYVRARRILRDEPKKNWPNQQQEILEIYRDKYRSTWGRDYKAKVLANFSNIMILDDHEIRDDFGSVVQDSDPESAEYFLGCQAIQVYHEYQRQLWDPEATEHGDTLSSEFYCIQIGPLGILMLETRTHLAIYKNQRPEGDESYFGKQQTDQLYGQLRADNGVRMWLVVSPVPLFFLSHYLAEAAAHNPFYHGLDDADGFINAHHGEEVAPILRELAEYKTRMAGSGDVILLSGDVHIGGFTKIFFRKQMANKQELFQQMTTSAIQNVRQSDSGWLGKLKFWMLDQALHIFTDKKDEFSYNHEIWKDQWNFGLVKVDFTNHDAVYYNAKLEFEDGSVESRSCHNKKLLGKLME